MKTSFKSIFSALVIPVSLVVAICVYIFIFGDGSHFQGGSNENMPLPGDFFGVIYKGGFIVPILMAFLLIVIVYSFERYFAIGKASGKINSVNFVLQIKSLLDKNSIKEAKDLCLAQKGSVGNVVLSSLEKYEQMEHEKELTKDQKLVAIQKEVEESTALELPSLEQNLVILATLSSVSTLVALLGTVIGMIRAFAAMSSAGAPDSTALATGISEALINTALGIGTAAVAVIMYNVFTTKIDKLTHSIDEAGYSIVQSYAANHK
ncbi:MAG: MotA/TolQ/ExbB proton channel family protein [Prevotellaceae bacterium]|jgi:biopolymer transport protein ExbB|nr:MotA/TolQ/ExbB proton channel family protein [Prevotellaceae bacterium]